MDQTLARAAHELRRRQALIDRVLSDTFPAQRAFIADATRMKAAKCSRRAGKSSSIGFDAVLTDAQYPGCNMLYTGLTRQSCVRILWKDVLKPLLKRYQIRATLNRQTLEVTFPSGSKLYMLGVDSGPDEREKALGVKYKKIWIDESQAYEQDLEDLVYRICKPAVADEQGTICLTGTADNKTHSLFYRVTTGEKAGWSCHTWTALDNPYMREQWLREMAELKRDNPGIEETPSYRQQYLGEWIVERSKLVYKFDPARNIVRELPQGDFWNVLGIDLGYSPDPSAFVVSAYRQHDRNLYFLSARKRAEMILSDVAAVIKQLERDYNIVTRVIDNANKQAVEELKQRYQLSLLPADKTGKADFIQIMNDELQLGHIKLVNPRGECQPLIDEWQTLIWDEKARLRDKFVESASCPNHCSDAALYNWRHCYQWVDLGQQKRKQMTDEDVVNEFWAHEAEELERSDQRQYWEQPLL